MIKSILLVLAFAASAVTALANEVKPTGCAFVAQSVFKGEAGQFTKADYTWQQGFEFDGRLGWGLPVEMSVEDGRTIFVGTTGVQQQEGVNLVVQVTEEPDRFTATARLVKSDGTVIAEDSGVAPLDQAFGTPPESVKLSVENPQVALFKEGLEPWQDVQDAENFPKGMFLVDSVEVYCSSGRRLRRFFAR